MSMDLFMGTILSVADPSARILRALASLRCSEPLLRIVLPVTTSSSEPLLMLLLVLSDVFTDCGGRILLWVPSLLVFSGVRARSRIPRTLLFLAVVVHPSIS